MTYEVKDPSTGPLFEVRIGHYIKTGWHTFLQYPAGFVGFLPDIGDSYCCIIINIFTRYRRLALCSGTFWSPSLNPCLRGVYVVSAKLLQRQGCAFTDFFAGFHYFQPLLIFGLIGALIWGGDKLFGPYRLLWVLFDLASLAFTLAFLFTPMLRDRPPFAVMGGHGPQPSHRPAPLVVFSGLNFSCSGSF